MEVEWRDIPEFMGTAQASSDGQVRSLPYTYYKPHYRGGLCLCERKGKVLKQKTNNRGYWQVHVNTGRIVCDRLVHRMVAMAFIPNPLNLPQINHIDEDKNNNRVENLEWCTNSYNKRYGTGISRSAQNTDYSKRRSNGKKNGVLQMDSDNNPIKKWNSVKDAAISIGVHPHSLSDTCCGIYKTCKGFKWEYIKE